MVEGGTIEAPDGAPEEDDARPNPALAPTAPATPPESEPALPATLGKYRVIEVLGAGGMGVVYAAHDPELDRKVAIKVLRPSARTSAPIVRARLQREAQAMARLSHPNVATVYEIGGVGDQVWVAMELVEGVTLAEWLREGGRTWRQIVSAFVAAGEGLAAAHRQGVVHRDFKPDNVLVSRAGRVCVSDFGLASVGGEEAPGPMVRSGTIPTDGSVTYSGQLAGTPGYMAPEQMRGEPTDARTDIFAYCVSVYEALYGDGPYAGKTLDELRASVEAERLQEPRSFRGPISYRRALERGLRCDPAKRQASMEELLAVLRVDPIARRNRRVGAAVALVAALAAIGIGVHQHRRLQVCSGADARLRGVWDGPRKQAVRASLAGGGASDTWPSVEGAFDSFASAWVAMSTQACEAARLRGTESEALFDRRTRCLDDRLSELRAASQILIDSGAQVARSTRKIAGTVGGLDRCEDAAHLLTSDADPPRAADKAEYDRLRDRLSEIAVLDVAGRRDAQRVVLAELEPQVRAFGNLALEADMEESRASSTFDQGRIEEAIAEWHQAAATAERARDDHMVVKSWRNLAYANMIQGRLEEALVWARYTEAGNERLGVPAPPRATVGSYEALALAQLGRTDEAVRAARATLALCEIPTTRESEAFVVEAARGNATAALGIVGRYEEALVAMRALYAQLVRTRGKDHPFTIASLSNVASYLVLTGGFDEAARVAEESLPAAETKLGSTSNETAEAAEALGQAEAGLGRLDAAKKHLEQALAIFEGSSPGGPEVVSALRSLGEVAQAQGRDAQPELERALKVGTEAKLSPLLLAPVRFALANALPAAARARAIALATEARDGYARSVGPGTDALARERDRVDAWLRVHSKS